MTAQSWGGTWDPATGALTFVFNGLSQVEALGILRLAEHAVIRQMTSGLPGRPGPQPEGSTQGAVRVAPMVPKKF